MSATQPFLHSDKKMFTVDQAYNRRNDRVVVDKDAEVTPVMTTKHPQGVMMLGVIGSDGKKMPPHFFPCGLKINTQVYLGVLRRVFKPWIKATYPDRNVIWQQDSAPAHGAKLTQAWLAKHLPGFWPKELWPSSSPDLSPLDFAIWGYLEPRACKTSHPNVESLKAAIRREWDLMSEDFVARSCQKFRPRIEAVIEAEGGHIE